VTLLHTRTHAGIADEVSIRAWGPLAYVGGQFAVLLGFWFVAWARAMWAHRPTRETKPELRFLWWMSAPTFVFFGLFSFKNGGGEPNWPLAGYITGMILVAGWMMEQWHHEVPWQRRLVKGGAIACVSFGLLLTVMVHDTITLQPVLLRIAGPASEQHPMPLRRVDPTSRLRGWRFLAGEVDRVRLNLKSRGIEPVLATERWTQTSELRFYCAGHPAAYCLGVQVGDRGSQYDLWRPNPVADVGVFDGQTFILVGIELDLLRPAFESFEPIRTVEFRENGQLIAAWKLAVAHGFRGWGE
jgi:hypothetical protein